MKKYPTIHYLERICTKCKHSTKIDGKRYCRLIMPKFDKVGYCLEFTQAPKHNEKYEQLSLFNEV